MGLQILNTAELKKSRGEENLGAGPVPDVDLQALEGPDAAWNLGHSVAAWQKSCKKTGGAMHRNPFLVGGLQISLQQVHGEHQNYLACS